MNEKIQNLINTLKATENASRMLSKKKGPGGVGFTDIGKPPIVEQTWTIKGKKIQRHTETGVVYKQPYFRAVLTDGKIEMIDGISFVSEKDALKILDEELAEKLRQKINSQKRKLKQKDSKIVIY